MKDKIVEKLIEREITRQSEVVNLIASENYVSDDVLAALGSPFVDKYAEGYPDARYYGGNEIVDEVELLCQKRALELFGLNSKKWAVNVQSLSGTPANLAVYVATLNIGDKIMGMKLSHGGHLSHGFKVSFTGKAWKQVPYTLDKKTEKINYDDLIKIAKKEKPAIVVAGYSAYSRKIDFKKMRAVADVAGALLLVDMSHIAGLVATKHHASPFKYADIVTTTTHKTLRGPRSAMIFSRIDDRKLNTRIDKSVFPGLQGGPHINQIAAVAVALREAATKKFEKYIAAVIANADVMAKELKNLGWKLVSGGTDNHLMLVDVFGSIGMGGKEAQKKLEEAGIIVNMNTIPFDTRSPRNPSGIRLGTAAETSRGAREKDFKKIAILIDTVLRA